MVKLEAMVEVYGEGNIRKVKAQGKDNKEALLKLSDKLCLYISSEEVEEREEDGEEQTFESLINEIKKCNGDGCDYIIYLKDLESGKSYINNVEEDED